MGETASRPASRREKGINDGELRINERIPVPEVRLIGADGEQFGIKPLAEALRMAREQDLDLVEVAPQARPPVCRVMDYGKYRYQQAVKAKEARRRQSQVVVKEMKMRPKIGRSDYETKARHVARFLGEGSKVKVTVTFRGREMTHAEFGRRLLDRLAEDMAELATVEAAPSQDGRNMVMILAPQKDRQPAPRSPAAPAAAEPNRPPTRRDTASA